MTRASQGLLVVFAFASALGGCTAILGDFKLGTTEADAALPEDGLATNGTGDDGTTGNDGRTDATARDAMNQGDGGVCVDMSTQCSASGGVQTCIAGAWGAAVPCNSGTCKMGACSGACTPNTSQCSGNSALQKCDATGVWGQPMACGMHQGCTGGGGAGAAMCTCKMDPTCSGMGPACVNSTTIASCGQDAQGCWYAASTSTCSNGACFGSAGIAQCCTNACTNSATQCGGAGLQTCQVPSQGNGCTAWNAGTACGPHQTCTGPSGSASCTCKVDSTCTAVGTVCLDPMTTATCAMDTQNCIYSAGSSPCGANQNCSSGSCVCNSGFTPCGNACVDIHTDNNNCGGCGKACPVLTSPNSGATCSNSTCIGYVGGYVLASGSLNANPDGMTIFAIKATMPGVPGTFQGIGGLVGSNDASGTTDMIYGLYSDNGGQPGSLYFYTNSGDPSLTFNDPSALHTVSSGGGLYQNSFNNVLTANTSYWVYMKAGANSSTGDIAGVSSSPCMGAQWINVTPPANFFAQGTRTCPGDFAAYMIVSFP